MTVLTRTNEVRVLTRTRQRSNPCTATLLANTLCAIYLCSTLHSTVASAEEPDSAQKNNVVQDVATHHETIVDLKTCMDLAGKNLLNMLCEKRNYLPYFMTMVERDYRAEMQFFHPHHNLGRVWDSLLRLEHATGFVIPANIEGAMLENLYKFFDNPDHLCLYPLDMPYKPVDLFCFHSLREHLLTLDSLVRLRNSRWARETAHKMLVTISNILLPVETWKVKNSVWDVAKTHRYRQLNIEKPHSGWALSLQSSEGRLIEPLLLYHKTTKDPLARELADKFAKFHLDLSTRPDGEFYGHPVYAGHNHSYLGTLRGVLYYGMATGQREYIEAVEKTYRVAIPKIVKKSGHTTHDVGREGGSDVASASDVAIMALWLGVYAGYPEHLDDVARIVRSRMIPSQILESPALTPKTYPPEKGEEPTSVSPDGRVSYLDFPPDMQQRIIGALGICTEPHAGKISVTDVTAAILQAMVEIYEHIAVKSDQDLTVYFHLNYEDEHIEIRSVRAEKARVTIRVKQKDDLRIRVPRWAPRESIQLSIGGQPVEPDIVHDFLRIPRDMLTGDIVLTHDLPVHKETERSVDVDWVLTWRGDEIIGIYPNSDFYPFFRTGTGH
jgi:hypothetical protein